MLYESSGVRLWCGGGGRTALQLEISPAISTFFQFLTAYPRKARLDITFSRMVLAIACRRVRPVGGRGSPRVLRLIDLIREAENTIYYENSHLFTSDRNPDLTVSELRSTLVRRDKGLISTAFSTGGRISEVLLLKRKNFLIFDKYVAVVNTPRTSYSLPSLAFPLPVCHDDLAG